MATILVADDSLVVQRTLSFILEKNDHTVLTAVDGVAALEILHEQPADLIIVDINMPRMDGVELLETIRSSARHANLPVVMLTSLGKTVEQLETMTNGANEILTKPVSSWQLIETIDRLLSAEAS